MFYEIIDRFVEVMLTLRKVKNNIRAIAAYMLQIVADSL